MGRYVLLGVLFIGAQSLLVGPASARESQLCGVRLGRPADMVTGLFGDPSRIFAGAAATGAGGAGMAGGPGGGPMGMPGAGGGPGGAMGMPGASGGPGGPMGMGGPGAMGAQGGASGAGSRSPFEPQKYEGKIAGLKPEDFTARLLATQSSTGQTIGEASGAPGMGGPGMGMGGAGMGGPGMGGPGMGGGMGGPGMGGAGQQGQSAAPPMITWIYERAGDGVTYVFGFSEDNRVSLVCIGDDKPYCVTKGGRKPPYAGARTAKGVGLGDSFKKVILAYGFPESTQIMGDEVLMKYFDRHGVAFTFRQDYMKVTSITIRSPEE